MYDVRVHSLRKIFKRQLVNKGVPEPFVDYFMGHKRDVYTDIESLGVERLRQVYSAAGHCIREKTRKSLIEAIKTVIRAYGSDPEKILTSEAMDEGAAADVENGDPVNHQVTVLRRTLREIVRGEVQAVAGPGQM